jgi:hypothetical protein
VRWVARPIEALKSEALRIAAGDRAPPAETAAPKEVRRLRVSLGEMASHLVASMRTAWNDTLAKDRARNAGLLDEVLGPPEPVVLVDRKSRRVVWRPADDSLETRLERQAMAALARRFAENRKLAARWSALAVARHGVVAEEAAA